jgi:hypothetical protein
MALLKCPECSNDASDKADACPKCGYPFQRGSNRASRASGCSPVIALGVIVLAGIVFLGLFNDGGPFPIFRPNSSPKSDLEAPVISIDADALYAAYHANEVSADARYKGRIVIVTGAIREIGKDILDSPYVVVGGSGFLDGVQCIFSRGDDSPVGDVSKGQRVNIRGRVSGKMGNVLLRECQFQ